MDVNDYLKQIKEKYGADQGGDNVSSLMDAISEKYGQTAPAAQQTSPVVPQTAPTLYTAESLLAGNAEVRERQAEIERLQQQLAAIPAGKEYDAERQLAQYDLSNAQAALTDINTRAEKKAASMQEDYAKWYAEDQKNVPYYNSIPQAKDFAANSVEIAKQTGRTTIEGEVASRMGNGMARFAPGQVIALLRERGATEDEIKTFVYLYNTKGWKEAEAYYQHILPAMNERAAQENYAKAREFANQHGVLATAASVPQNLGGGVAGALDLTYQNARRALTGRPVDYNTPNLQMANYANEMRGQVSENIQAGVTEGTGSEFAGKAASFLYNTGNSMLDSASVMGLTVAGLPNAAYLLGTSAGVNATQEAHRRGATDGQAFAAGVLAGVAEEFFEEYSIEKFFSLKKPNGFSDLAKNVIKQAIPEASEEVATSLANALSEAIILRDKSAFNDGVRKYMEDGLSEEEARNRALKDFAVSLGLDALGGFLSGGVFGAAGGVGQTMNQIRQGADVRREGQTENLKSSASTLTGTESARMAQALSDKPSDLAVGRLAQQVQDDSVKAAEIMLKQSNGEALTADEQAFITPFQNTQQTAPATQEQQTVTQKTTQATQNAATEAQNAPATVQTANNTAEENTAPAANQTVETPARQEYDNALNSTVRRMAEIEYARNEIADDVTDDVVRQMREANRRVLADETEYNMSAESRNAMNPFLKALAATGRKIRYEDFSQTMPREKWANIGYFDTKTGEIVLNKSLSVNPSSEYAARQIRKVILHEMGHTLRQTKAYKGMERFIRDSYAGDEAWNNRLQKEVDRRAEQGEYFDLANKEDRAAIEEEVVVDEMAALLKDSRNVARLIKDDRSLAQKIYDGIHDFLQRVGSVKDAKARAELRDLRTAEKLLGQALKEDNAQKKASRSVNQQILEDQTAKKNAPKKNESRKFSGNTVEQENTSAKASTNEKNKFSGDTIVEEKGDLIALHNLSEENLQKALKLGGFPMPSIAVTRQDIPHTNFGDITLVMNRSTIDPQASRKNTVYAADAWTPTFPSTEYEADENVQKRISDKYYSLSKKLGYDFTRPLYRYTYELEDALNRMGGEEGLIKDAKEGTDLMQVYLADIGKEPVANVTHETVSRLSDNLISEYNSLVDALGEDVFEEITPKEGDKIGELRRAWFDKHGDELKNAWREWAIQNGVSEDTARSAEDATSRGEWLKLVLAVRNYIRNGAETRKTETDYAATRDAIRKAAGKGFDQWVEDLFRGAEKSSGIYNGKERYTRSGNLRSFRQTHVPATLENIASVMASQNDGNSRNVSGFYGVKSLRAGLAKRFSSIAEMHEYENRLQHLTEEEAAEINDALGKRLSDVINRIYNTGRHSATDNVFIEFDRIGNNLMEIAEASKITPDRIKATLKKYGYTVNDALAQDIRALLFDISEMPVNIFEAKPERPVRFDEVLAAVVPTGTSEEVINALKDQGVDVMTYTEGNDAERMAKANSVPNAKFSGDTITPEMDAEYSELAKNPEKNKAALEKMVEQAAKDAGYNIKAYHGTRSDAFTEFDVRRSGQNYSGYNAAGGGLDFTTSEKFAHLWGAKARGEGTPRVIPVYLKADKTFYSYHGKVDPALETLLPDSMTKKQKAKAMEFGAEFHKALDAAGINFKDAIQRFGYDSYAMFPGDENISVYSPEQVKSADAVTYDSKGNIIPLSERFNSNEPDIRWSSDTITDAILADMREEADREAEAQAERVSSSVEGAYDTAKELAAAQKEIARLSERLAYWKQQTRLTKTPSINEKAVAKQARAWLKEYGATDQGLAGAVTDLYNDLLRGEIDFSEAHDRATDIAKDMVDSIVVKNTSFADQYKDLTDSLKDSPIVLTKDEARGIDNFNDLRKSHFGKVAIRVVENLANETSLDRRYQELASEYPEFFPEDVLSTEDKLQKIFDAADKIYDSKNRIISPFDNDVEGAEAVAADLANEILERFYDIPQVKTAADRLMQRQTVRTAGIVNRMQERSEAQIERLEQKQSEALAKMQERNQKKIDRLLQKQADMIAHNKEMQERARTRRQESEVTQRLLKIARRLHSMKTAPEFRSAIDEIIGEYDLVSAGMRENGYTRSDGVIVNGRVELTQMLDDYIERAKTDPDFIDDPSIRDRLERVNKKHFADLSLDEKIDMTEALLQLEHQIRTYNKEVGVAKARSLRELSQNAIREVRESKGINPASKTLGIKNLYGIKSLRPETFFAQMGGYKNGTIASLYQQLEDGQTKTLDFTMKATTPFDEFTKKHKREVAKWSGKNCDVITLRDLEGNPVTGPSGRPLQINPSMRIALYLHSLNSQNMAHIASGGITIPDMRLYKMGRTSEAYAHGQTVKLLPSQIDAITSQMTAAEREFAELTHNYFNIVSKQALNDTSLALRGYEVAQVENYFPIKSDSDFLASNFESLVRDGTLEGMGFLKERKNAKNPLMLEAVDSVLTRQIGDTAKYVGMAIPIRNFTGGDGQKGAYNWITDEGTLTKAVGDTWGSEAKSYIEKLMTDLQNTKQNGSQLMNAIRGNYAAAVLNFNPAVALGQAASYPTAADTLGWAALAKGLAMKPADTALIAKYTPLLWYRSKGYVDTDLGNIKNYGGRIARIMGNLPGAKWIQKVDMMTVRQLWNASEAWVQMNTDLKKGTEDYYRKTSEMFNKTIYQTQPNYTTLQRPQILRSDSEIERSIFMFATQRMQNYNMMYQALGEMAAAKRGGDRKAFARMTGRAASTAATLLVANTVYTAMRNAVRRAIRKDDDEWENEEGQITWLNGLLHGFWKNAAGSIVFGSEIADIASALAGGKYYDTFSVPAIETLNGLIDSSVNFAKETQNMLESGYPQLYLSQNPKFFKYAKELASGMAQMFGVPVSNYEKYIHGVLKWINPVIAKRWEYLTKRPAKGDVYDARTDAEEKAVFNAYVEEATGVTSSGLYDLWQNASPDVSEKYFPPQMANKFTVDGEEHKLDPKQYAEADAIYEKTVGDNLSYVVSNVRRSNEEIQVKALNTLYSYAEAKAKASAVDSFELSRWMVCIDDCIKAGIPLSAACAYRAEGEYKIDHRDKTNKKVGAKETAENYIESIRPKLTQKQKRALFSVLSTANNPYEEKEQG